MKSNIKTLYKTAIVVALLTGLAVVSQAQVVIGSWQSAPIPPDSTNSEGWYHASGSLGNLGSVFASSNCPSLFDLQANVASGYAQSLVVHETGWGNDRLGISLSADQITAFTNNSRLSFTFSVPAAGTTYTAGYIQMVQFIYNSSTSGYKGLTPNTAGNFSETGDIGNNSSGQPIFYYSSGAAARQQVVTWDYSSIRTNFIGASYLQMNFVFQIGGGAPTNLYINNVSLSGGTSSNTILVDAFNPTNNTYAGTNVYALGQITNIYANWFGDAFSNVVWDANHDAQGLTNFSGSLKITANFGTNGGSQFLVMDKGPSFSYAGISPAITNGIGLLTFECDVRYDTNSPTWVTGGGTNYGNLQFGILPPYSSQDVIGSVNISVTNTGWAHVSIPLNAAADANLLSFSGLFIKMDGANYGNLQGTTILWVDNLEFTYTNITVIPQPTLSLSKATPGLRIFAGSTVDTYDRAELVTIDSNQSWIGGSYPVSYSFTLLSYPANIGQTHIFLIPTNTSGQANMGNVSGSVNEYIDYQATNGFWLLLSPAGSGKVVASVEWKTNRPNANPTNVVLQITNTAVGTWTLTFNSAATGSLTAPGAGAVSFSIGDPNVATDFANPLVAYFGLQPNSTTGIGQYEDWGSIKVTGVSGVNEDDNFTTDSSFNTSLWNINTLTVALQSSVKLVTTSTPYWAHWTQPATGFALATGTNISASVSNNTTAGWMLPEYYNNYNDGLNLPGQASQGTNTWVLLPTNCLPTVDGQPGSALVPNAYFLLTDPILDN